MADAREFLRRPHPMLDGRTPRDVAVASDPAMHWIAINIPAGTRYETFPAHAHPGWDGASERICKDYGDAWIAGGRSALLFVPSVPARLDRNVLINRAHPDAERFSRSRPEPVAWDGRLFRSAR